ncbi:hypothetical protein ACGC1H_000932 [Rhizoctonia solani]|uniref:Uncharacterized protein n=1 Tax=Rhizoctonia solani TaxID=456999 RepID=A0A8H2XKT4_9AGAM|nr:unnamed protein product [Rhizoctonia solani]
MMLPTLVTLEPRPRQRYTPYRRTREPTWLDALNCCILKSKSKLTWRHELKREQGNKATHIMTPVLTCIMYEKPGEDVQMRLRRAASTRLDAIEAVKSAIRSGLDGKELVDFYGSVEDDGQANSHCRYKVVDISYTYRLDNWPVTECQGEDATKKHARQKAARRLLESGTYCMFVRKSNGASRR